MPPAEDGDGLASAEVHRRLREQILDGELAPGRPRSLRAGALRDGRSQPPCRPRGAEAAPAGRPGEDQPGWRHEGARLAPPRRPRPAARPDAAGRHAPPAVVGPSSRCGPASGWTSPPLHRARGDERRTGSAPALPRRRLVEAGREADSSTPTLSLWELIVDGSANLAYRLALNSLNGALAAFPELAAALAPKRPGEPTSLGAAIAAGAVAEAVAAARVLLERDIGAVDLNRRPDRLRLTRARP